MKRDRSHDEVGDAGHCEARTCTGGASSWPLRRALAGRRAKGHSRPRAAIRRRPLFSCAKGGYDDRYRRAGTSPASTRYRQGQWMIHLRLLVAGATLALPCYTFAAEKGSNCESPETGIDLVACAGARHAAADT